MAEFKVASVDVCILTGYGTQESWKESEKMALLKDMLFVWQMELHQKVLV